MQIPGCPAWIAAINLRCCIGFGVISIAEAKAAVDLFEDYGKDKQKRMITMLTADAEAFDEHRQMFT